MLFPSRLNLIHLHGNHLINHIYTEKLTNQREANKHKPAVIVEQRAGQRLQAASDEPDLVPATGDARVLIHGHHVVVSAQLIVDAQDLPQQSDLTAHCDLGGRPEKWPDNQSEGRVSDSQSELSTESASHTEKVI